MIERIWSGHSWLYIFLLPFSWLYGAISVVRRWGYRIGIFSSWRSPVPVIVVGNLTVGGNGKTPVVIELVEHLKQRGFCIGVVSRGYGGKAESYPLVLNAKTTADEAGDEPVLIQYRTGVPVAVAPRRSDAIKALLASNELDAIITDDGLQHYALARDYEIVIIDGERRFGNGWWLPAGSMRERESRLASVNRMITNGGQAKQGEIAMSLCGNIAINLDNGEKRVVSELLNVVAMAGIGYPPRFFNSLEQLGVQLVGRQAFPDHQPYTLPQLTQLATREQTLLMTEKDAVKCRSFSQENWWYLPVSANLSGSGVSEMWDDIIRLIIKK